MITNYMLGLRYQRPYFITKNISEMKQKVPFIYI